MVLRFVENSLFLHVICRAGFSYAQPLEIENETIQSVQCGKLVYIVTRSQKIFIYNFQFYVEIQKSEDIRVKEIYVTHDDLIVLLANDQLYKRQNTTSKLLGVRDSSELVLLELPPLVAADTRITLNGIVCTTGATFFLYDKIQVLGVYDVLRRNEFCDVLLKCIY